jgi:hypothetical protein
VGTLRAALLRRAVRTGPRGDHPRTGPDRTGHNDPMLRLRHTYACPRTDRIVSCRIGETRIHNSPEQIYTTSVPKCLSLENRVSFTDTLFGRHTKRDGGIKVLYTRIRPNPLVLKLIEVELN